jgi:hypothetical protein
MPHLLELCLQLHKRIKTTLKKYLVDLVLFAVQTFSRKIVFAIKEGWLIRSRSPDPDGQN